jgi:hypothetical protein
MLELLGARVVAEHAALIQTLLFVRVEQLASSCTSVRKLTAVLQMLSYWSGTFAVGTLAGGTTALLVLWQCLFKLVPGPAASWVLCRCGVRHQQSCS